MTHPRIGLAFALLLVGCGSPLEPESISLTRALDRWQQAGITSYDFDFQESCFCLEQVLTPVTISVRNGLFTGLVSTDSGTAIDSTYFRGYLTIDQVFASLRRFNDSKPAQFAGSYDPSLGVPLQVYIDGDRQAVDDELTLRILAVRVTPLARNVWRR